MPFKQIVTTDQDLQLIQSAVASEFNVLESAPFLNGHLVTVITNPGSVNAQTTTNITLTASQDNLIAHGLGRPLTMWIVVRKDTNTTVWEVATSKLAPVGSPIASSDNNFINLHCATTCVVSLWVA